MNSTSFTTNLRNMGFKKHDRSQKYCDIIHDDSSKQSPESRYYATHPCFIKSLLDGATSMTSKNGLWDMVPRYFKDKYMLESFVISSIDEITTWTVSHSSDTDSTKLNKTYIIKPSDDFSGHGILTTDDAKTCITHGSSLLQSNKISRNQKHKKRSPPKIVISEYMEYPLLLEGKKFHLRAYFTASVVNNRLKTFVLNCGKMYTAELPYIHGDYGNLEIHDTHVKSTKADLLWPRDIVKEYPKIEKTLLSQITKIFKGITAKLYNKLEPYPECKNAYHTFGADIMIDVRNGTDCNCADCCSELCHDSERDKVCKFAVKLIEINRKTGFTFLTDEGRDQFSETLYSSILSSIIAPAFDKTTFIKSSMIALN